MMPLLPFLQLTAAVFLAMLMLVFYFKAMYIVLEYFQDRSHQKNNDPKNSEI